MLSACLVFALRSVLCADVDGRGIPYHLRCSLGLLACRLGCGGDGVLISSVRMCCDVLLAARRLVSFLASFIIPSVGSVHLVSPRLATRWAGRRADALRLRRAIVPRSDFTAACLIPRACLPRVVLAIHLMRMAAAVCGLSARRALLACHVVSVPPLVARSSPFMDRSIGAALCRRPDVVGMSSGGHDMLCIIPFFPIVCGCLRRAG